jgi:hypothetical protein
MKNEINYKLENKSLGCKCIAGNCRDQYTICKPYGTGTKRSKISQALLDNRDEEMHSLIEKSVHKKEIDALKLIALFESASSAKRSIEGNYKSETEKLLDEDDKRRTQVTSKRESESPERIEFLTDWGNFLNDLDYRNQNSESFHTYSKAVEFIFKGIPQKQVSIVKEETRREALRKRIGYNLDESVQIEYPQTDLTDLTLRFITDESAESDLNESLYLTFESIALSDVS